MLQKQNYKLAGIGYEKPRVYLLGNTQMLFAEYSARTAYDSFDKSENEQIKALKYLIDNDELIDNELLDSTEASSELLEQLSHVYFHESTLEHIVFNLFIKGTSRGVLQELARHRLMSPTVKSTRYTLNDVINTFLVAKKFNYDSISAECYFVNECSKMDLFVTSDFDYNYIELQTIFRKIDLQYRSMPLDDFYSLSIAKSLIDKFKEAETILEAYKVLNSKDKKNVGDAFKHIITDNFKVDLGLTINLRSLKNMLDLRLSGSAYFQFQVLASEIFKTIPDNYKRLIDTGKLASQQETIEEKYKCD